MHRVRDGLHETNVESSTTSSSSPSATTPKPGMGTLPGRQIPSDVTCRYFPPTDIWCSRSPQITRGFGHCTAISPGTCPVACTSRCSSGPTTLPSCRYRPSWRRPVGTGLTLRIAPSSTRLIRGCEPYEIPRHVSLTFSFLVCVNLPFFFSFAFFWQVAGVLYSGRVGANIIELVSVVGGPHQRLALPVWR